MGDIRHTETQKERKGEGGERQAKQRQKTFERATWKKKKMRDRKRKIGGRKVYKRDDIEETRDNIESEGGKERLR